MGQNKKLLCTELERKLVEIFLIKELFDLEFTRRLEKTLYDIEKQKFTKEAFFDLIYEFTTNAVDRIKSGKKRLLMKYNKKKYRKKYWVNALSVATGSLKELKDTVAVTEGMGVIRYLEER